MDPYTRKITRSKMVSRKNKPVQLLVKIPLSSIDCTQLTPSPQPGDVRACPWEETAGYLIEEQIRLSTLSDAPSKPIIESVIELEMFTTLLRKQLQQAQ